MAKHKTKQYRRSQRDRHIEKRKNIIRNTRYGILGGYEWQEEYTMPTAGKLAKGKVRDCMGEYCSFNEYTLSEQKRAASMLDELNELNDLNRISGPLKSRLIRIIKNNPRHKDKNPSNCQKETFSYEKFQVLLSESENCWFHIIKPDRWTDWLNYYCGYGYGYLNRTA